jgi:hypothetical protein
LRRSDASRNDLNYFDLFHPFSPIPSLSQKRGRGTNSRDEITELYFAVLAMTKNMQR